MEIIIQNDVIKARINTLGGELTNLVLISSNTDYMWSGDAAYWSGRSPVLFPIIGSLNEGHILIDGEHYSMGNHGFARKSEFKCIVQEDHSATFRLTDSEVTLAQYPFGFTLDLVYTLIGTAVSIKYVITNTNDRVMPFQLGTHAAFNCPLGNTQTLKQWHLAFDQKETLSRIGLKDNLLDLDDLTLVMDDSDILPLNHDLFKDSAIVFKEVFSKTVALKSDATEESITVSFDGLPDLAIWQPHNAPFLCIEPWHGHGDTMGFEGDIMEKIGMVHLDAHETYEAELRIRIE